MKILKNKTLAISSILFGVLTLIYITINTLFANSPNNHNTQILFDKQTGELTFEDNIRKDKTIKNIKSSPNDFLFRRNNYLIHQETINQEVATSTVYRIKPDNQLKKVFKLNNTILDYKDKHNYIFNEDNKTILMEKGKKVKFERLCRKADYFQTRLICIGKSGGIFKKEKEGLKRIVLKKDNHQILGITLISYKDKLYITGSTLEENPKIYIFINNNIENLQTYDRVYNINDVPISFIPQEERLILNTRRYPIKRYKNNNLQLYSITNTIEPLKQYKSNLMIVF